MAPLGTRLVSVTEIVEGRRRVNPWVFAEAGWSTPVNVSMVSLASATVIIMLALVPWNVAVTLVTPGSITR